MKKRISGLGVVLCSMLTFAAAGCARQSSGPKVASSATQSSYAVTHPAELAATSARLAATQTVAKAAISDFATFPDKLKTTDFAYVERIYTLANAEGRSESYAEGFANAQVVNEFFAREKSTLTGRVAGANEKASEKAGCTAKAEFYGATSYSLEHAVGESLEDDLKERSDAQNSIDQNKRKLGDRDAATLSTQAQQISMASHAVFVGLPLQKSRTERLLAQVNDVDSTLEARAEELQKIDTKGMNYEEKKWLSEETKAVATARNELGTSKEQAKVTLDQIEAQSDALEKEYNKAFDALIDKVQARAKAAKK